MNRYSVGTRVFCDFHFGGKPNGVAVEIIEPGNGKNTKTGIISVKFSETIGAYKKGETIKIPAWQAVPKKQEFRKAGSFFRYINTDFEWVK